MAVATDHSPTPPVGVWRFLHSIWSFKPEAVHKYSVDDLTSEAEMVSAYSARAGILNDDSLLQALRSVEDLPRDQRVLTAPAVVDLLTKLSETRESIPFSTVIALRAGWDPGRDTRAGRLTSLGFVVASLLLMLAVGNLTLNYNIGVRLYQELLDVQARNPAFQFSKLERQLLEAENGLVGKPSGIVAAGPVAASAIPDTNGSSPLESSLARDASFQYAYELLMLDKELRLYKNKSDAFIADADRQLSFIPAFWTAAQRKLASIKESCSLVDRPDCKKDYVIQAQETSDKVTQDHDMNYGTLAFDPSSIRNFCRYLVEIDVVRSNGRQENSLPTFDDKAVVSKDRLEFINAVRYLFADMLGIDTLQLLRQNCRLGLNYYTQSIPNILEMQNNVHARLSSYSFIVLPMLYGALGSLMYFMRRVMDPLLPNPKFLRAVHRVALGALAGMVLAWLWDGMFAENGAISTIGFGLFTLAFIFGFSIDVFFTLLERMVKLATNGVIRIGEPAQR
jgi:hypothetical protein